MLQKVVKRKKVDPEVLSENKKKSKTVFQSAISTTKFSEVGGNEKSLKVTVTLKNLYEKSCFNIWIFIFRKCASLFFT